MLTVTLYEFRKRENSTKRPDATVTQREHQAVLQAPISLLAPELTFDFGLKGNPSFYNYVYISDFGNRYYFVRDWTAGEGHLWTAHCEVDVLASWKNTIGESTQYVKRSSYTYNGGIIDPIYPTIQPPTITITKDTSPWTTALASGCYILGIVNNEDGGMGASHYYMLTQSQMNKMLTYLLGDVGDYAGNITDISSELTKVLFNPMQYISSCVWYPFTITPDQTGNVKLIENMPIGWWTLTGIDCYELNITTKYFTSVLELPQHPQASDRGVYLNRQPFTSYTLYYPGIGTIVLDPSLVAGTDNLVVQCVVDLIANQARLNVRGYGLASVQYSQIGVPIQLAQMSSQMLNMASGLVGGMTKAVASAATGSVSGAIGGIFDGISSAVSSAYPEVSVTGSNGSIASLSEVPQLRTVCYLLVPENNADLGRPLCSTRKLSTIPGYQMILHADIAIPGTRQENQAIKNYLESGYFYE